MKFMTLIIACAVLFGYHFFKDLYAAAMEAGMGGCAG